MYLLKKGSEALSSVSMLCKLSQMHFSLTIVGEGALAGVAVMPD